MEPNKINRMSGVPDAEMKQHGWNGKHVVDTRLIQQLLKPSPREVFNPYAFGAGYKNGGLHDEIAAPLAKIFDFSYMGAAQYEFGAVPQALANMWDERAYMKESTLRGNKQADVDILAPEYLMDHAVRVIKSLKRKNCKEVSLRDPSLLLEALDPAHPCKVVGWLELDNGFFFTIDPIMSAAFKKFWADQPSENTVQPL